MSKLPEVVSSMSLESFFQREFFEEVLSRKGVTKELEKRQHGQPLLTARGNLTRTLNILYSARNRGMKVSDLLAMSDRELGGIPDMGKKGIKFIDAYLCLFDLQRTTVTTVDKLEQVLSEDQKTVLRLLS